MLPARLLPTALTTALTLTLATGATAGPIELGKLTIKAAAKQSATSFPGQLPIPDLDNQESETWTRPGPFVGAGGADGIADADTFRLAPHSNLPIYSATRQTTSANAVGVRHTYAADSQSVALEARTDWTAVVHNTGDTSMPVEFSFFLSGGGITAWCAVCVTGLVAEVDAKVHYAAAGQAPIWNFNAKVSWTASTGPALTTSGSDPFGIGFPNAYVLSMPSAADHYVQIGIDAFHPEAFDLGFLLGKTGGAVMYSLTAKISSVGSAYATAWLVDPFELGQAPGSLPSSGFTINGESIESLLAVGPTAPGVPEPGTLLLLLAGLGGFALRFGRKKLSVRSDHA